MTIAGAHEELYNGVKQQLDEHAVAAQRRKAAFFYPEVFTFATRCHRLFTRCGGLRRI